jgi:hypothetical protein
VRRVTRQAFATGDGRQASGAFRSGDTSRRPEARWLTAATLLILFIAPMASACPVCWGAPDDPMVKGVNSGIWVLLGLVGFVQLGFVAMFYSFWRKAREHRRFRESLRVIEGGPHA